MSAYGVLYSLIYAFFIVRASVGPVLAGKIFDMTGNYSLAIWAVIGLLLTGAGAVLTLPRFDRARFDQAQATELSAQPREAEA